MRGNFSPLVFFQNDSQFNYNESPTIIYFPFSGLQIKWDYVFEGVNQPCFSSSDGNYYNLNYSYLFRGLSNITTGASLNTNSSAFYLSNDGSYESNINFPDSNNGDTGDGQTGTLTAQIFQNDASSQIIFYNNTLWSANSSSGLTNSTNNALIFNQIGVNSVGAGPICSNSGSALFINSNYIMYGSLDEGVSIGQTRSDNNYSIGSICFINYNTSNSILGSNLILCCFHDPSTGIFLVGTNEGLYKSSSTFGTGMVWEKIISSETYSCWMYNSTIFAANINGLYISTNLGSSFVLVYNNSVCYAVYADSDGLFFGTAGDGLGFSESPYSTFTYLTTSDGLPSNTIYCIAKNGNNVAVGGPSGIAVSPSLASSGSFVQPSDQSAALYNINVASIQFNSDATIIFSACQDQSDSSHYQGMISSIDWDGSTLSNSSNYPSTQQYSLNAVFTISQPQNSNTGTGIAEFKVNAIT